MARQREAESREQSETDRRWMLLMVVSLAFMLLIPLMALAEHRVEYLESGFSVVAPFVFFRVAVFQLAFTLPLLLFFAYHVGRWIRIPVWVAAIFGLIVTVVAAIAAETLSLQSMTSSVTNRHVIRFVWCAVLQLPWAFVAAGAWQRVESPEYRRGWRSIPWVDGTVVLMLLVLPVIFVRQEIERQETLVVDLFRGKQQYKTSLDAVYRVSALGGEQVMERPIADVLAGLTNEVARLNQSVAQTLPEDATVDVKLQRAIDLISLGELDPAAELLAPMTQPRAKFHAARIAALRRDWLASVEGFGEVINGLAKEQPLDESQLAVLRAAMERKVNNLRRAGEYRQAEDELKRAIEDWPAARPRFLLQLALHYKLAGRGADAVDYFLKAADADPSLSKLAIGEISLLKGQAQGCLIRINRAASR